VKVVYNGVEYDEHKAIDIDLKSHIRESGMAIMATLIKWYSLYTKEGIDELPHEFKFRKG
jgi:hypothetical protein